MTSDNQNIEVSSGAGIPRRRFLQIGALGIVGVAGSSSFLAACGSDSGSDSSTTPTTSPTNTEAIEAIKVHFVYVGPPDDNGWTQAHQRQISGGLCLGFGLLLALSGLSSL